MSRWLVILITVCITTIVCTGTQSIFWAYAYEGYVDISNLAFVCRRHQMDRDWMVCAHENGEEFTLVDPAVTFRYTPPPASHYKHERPRARTI